MAGNCVRLSWIFRRGPPHRLREWAASGADWPRSEAVSAAVTAPERSSWQATPIVLGLAMVATALGVRWLQPEPLPVNGQQSLAQSVPTRFGDWKEVPFAEDQIDPGKGTADEPNMDRPYDDVL